MLTVPQPQLLLEDGTPAPSPANPQKVLNLACSPVTFADGTPLTPDNATRAAYLLYREQPVGTTTILDAQSKAWVDASSPLQAQPLLYEQATWKGVVVPPGPPPLGPPSAVGTPRYYVRCFFGGRETLGGTEDSGVSPASATFTFFDADAAKRVDLQLTPKDPTQATQVELFLKDSSGTRGSIAIKPAGGGYQLVLTLDTATITLQNDGAIALQPAAGKRVSIGGELEVATAIYVNSTKLAVP
jgi:hypothetical protein